MAEIEEIEASSEAATAATSTRVSSSSGSVEAELRTWWVAQGHLGGTAESWLAEGMEDMKPENIPSGSPLAHRVHQATAVRNIAKASRAQRILENRQADAGQEVEPKSPTALNQTMTKQINRLSRKQ